MQGACCALKFTGSFHFSSSTSFVHRLLSFRFVHGCFNWRDGGSGNVVLWDGPVPTNWMCSWGTSKFSSWLPANTFFLSLTLKPFCGILPFVFPTSFILICFFYFWKPRPASFGFFLPGDFWGVWEEIPATHGGPRHAPESVSWEWSFPQMLFEDADIGSKGLQAQEHLCAFLQLAFVAPWADLDVPWPQWSDRGEHDEEKSEAKAWLQHQWHWQHHGQRQWSLRCFLHVFSIGRLFNSCLILDLLDVTSIECDSLEVLFVPLHASILMAPNADFNGPECFDFTGPGHGRKKDEKKSCYADLHVAIIVISIFMNDLISLTYDDLFWGLLDGHWRRLEVLLVATISDNSCLFASRVGSFSTCRSGALRMTTLSLWTPPTPTLAVEVLWERGAWT